ncbi:nucleotidyltransferase [Paraliobacillus quinghaiensis]|uniref:Nucleotidyltransferase n=1 Tax=Paraliobacillus quinghaiensis TaxID=470815 RepID=A0A917TRL8_9BACI|nr:nucleotidyltransferase domain-containing protein [Paraliobacillus quinghaiensis]GGM33775.1 nucleotidyltransferase [Paraliobacillus quinghaiensis]
MKKIAAFEAAKRFIETEFTTCDGALLAGSVVRGGETETSDLDIIVFDKGLQYSYRESIIRYGWPIEVFVHNLISYRSFFAMDAAKGMPTLPRMVTDGAILFDSGVLDDIKREAQEFINQGPPPWPEETIKLNRYILTDRLDDFLGSNNREEDICIAVSLASIIHEFYLRTNLQWIGESKWIYRSLNNFNPDFAARYIYAFEQFYQKFSKKEIVALAEEILAPYGGRLFEGFSLGKE